MRHRRLLPVLLVAAVLGFPAAASASTVTVDLDRQLCIASDSDSSEVVAFWDTLEEDVRKARIDELDAADPGFRAVVEAYVAGAPDAPSATDLQTRMDALNSGEGLAMLLPEETTDPEVLAQQEATQFKTEYTYEEAVETAGAISDDPAGTVLPQLEEAAAQGTRTAELRAETFAQRTGEYNRTQLELRDEFQACVDAIDDARPIPLQYLILGAAVLIAVLALAARAWSNHRRGSRHERR